MRFRRQRWMKSPLKSHEGWNEWYSWIQIVKKVFCRLSGRLSGVIGHVIGKLIWVSVRTTQESSSTIIKFCFQRRGNSCCCKLEEEEEKVFFTVIPISIYHSWLKDFCFLSHIPHRLSWCSLSFEVTVMAKRHLSRH